MGRALEHEVGRPHLVRRLGPGQRLTISQRYLLAAPASDLRDGHLTCCCADTDTPPRASVARAVIANVPYAAAAVSVTVWPA